MATMDPMGLVMNLLPQAQQSFQNSMRSAKRSFNNTDGNFWQKLGAGAMGYLDEVFTGDLALDEQLDAEQRAKDEYDRQFAMQNEEYDRRVADERAYNDPSAQAARLKDAGINPMSTLGSMSPASNTAGDPGQPSANIPFKSGMSDLVAMIEAQNQSRLISSQVKLNDANAEAVEDRNAREGEMHIENLIGKRLANELAEVEKIIAEATVGDKIQLSHEQLNQVIFTNDKLKEERNLLVKQGKIADKELVVMDKKIEEMDSVIAVNYAQVALAESNVDYNDARIKELADRLAFDKEVESRVKAQGLAGLRLQSAELGLDKKRFDWEQTVKEIDQELRNEGLDIGWGNLGVSTISAITWALTFYFSRNPSTSTATAKGASTIIRRILKTAKR